MNLQEKLALIEEVLDVETGSLTPETLLAEVGEWDSSFVELKILLTLINLILLLVLIILLLLNLLLHEWKTVQFYPLKNQPKDCGS